MQEQRKNKMRNKGASTELQQERMRKLNRDRLAALVEMDQEEDLPGPGAARAASTGAGAAAGGKSAGARAAGYRAGLPPAAMMRRRIMEEPEKEEEEPDYETEDISEPEMPGAPGGRRAAGMARQAMAARRAAATARTAATTAGTAAVATKALGGAATKALIAIVCTIGPWIVIIFFVVVIVLMILLMLNEIPGVNILGNITSQIPIP